jgi:hypothetical protein
MSQKDGTALDSFFRDQALYGRYRWPLSFVVVAGVLWAMQPVAIYYSLGSAVGDQIQNAIAIDTLIHFVIPGFLWLYFWAAFVLLSHFSGGRMRVGRLFRLTAWGMLPFALIGAVRALGKYYAYQGKELPIGVVIGRFPSEWRGYSQLTAEYAEEPLLVGSLVGSCALLLASVYVWTFVIKYSTDLEDRRKIRAIALVPTVGYVGYAVGSTLL